VNTRSGSTALECRASFEAQTVVYP
jgi:hypothetical protein